MYAPLVRNLQILHPGYKFEIESIVVRAMGYVPKCLVTYLKMVGFEGKYIKLLILRMQVKSISGSVKICKTFLSFNYFSKVNPEVYSEAFEISLVETFCENS